MKSTLLNIKSAGVVASLTATALVGCRNDFDFESQYMQKLEYSYAKSFEKIYGEIDPDQSWDFSSSAKANGDTRAAGDVEISKRYMVEDLGSTDDIDFNDVVVDLEIYTLNGETKQRAIVRCMGGTLEFDLFIGGTRIITKSEMSCDAESIVASEMYNTLPGKDESGKDNIDYLKEMYVVDNISGWIPADNNIAFRVHRNNDEIIEISDYDAYNVYDTTVEGYTYIEFPRVGEVPYMMAFDTGKKWRDERHQICRHWVEGGNDVGTARCNECE